MIIHQRSLFFVLLLPWCMHGQINQQLQMLSGELKKIESMLHQPLTTKSINNISNQLAHAKAKIILLENQLAMSSEKRNPFLPGFIAEIKQKIESLEIALNDKKTLLTPLKMDNDTEQLLDRWYDYQLRTMDPFTSFNARVDSAKNPFRTPAQQQKEDQQKRFNAWQTSALYSIEYALKTAQNSLLDLTLHYLGDYEKEFNAIISIIQTVPELPAPLIPTRSSSLTLTQAPTPPFEITEQAPPVTEKNFFDDPSAFIQKKAVEAKQYAEEHASSITERLKNFIASKKNEEKNNLEQYASYVTPRTIKTNLPQTTQPKDPSEKIKKIVHAIYNSKKKYAPLIALATQLQPLLYCMEFVELSKTFANPFTLEALKQEAHLVGHILTIHAQQSIDKREAYFSIKKNVYDSIVVWPTLLYTTVLTKQMAWISQKAHAYYTQIKTMLHNSIHPVTLRSTVLTTQEQHDCIIYMHTFLQQQSFTKVEDIVAAYILFHSMSIITSPYKKNLFATQELISNHALKMVLQTKEHILSFIKGSLYPALQSPFPLTKDLFNKNFHQLNTIYTLEPLIVLLKETHNHDFALCIQKDYEQIDLVMNTIHNAFAFCTKKAKERATKEKNLTAMTLLHEQLERILLLIKPYLITK